MKPFSPTRTPLFAFLLLTFAASCGHGEPQGEEVIQGLRSERPEVRLEAAQELTTKRIGLLKPEVAIRAVVIALQDPQEKIRRHALGGLTALTYTLHMKEPNPLAAEFAKEIRESKDLRPALERVLKEDKDARVAIAASAPYMTLYGSDPKAEELLLTRIEREPFPIEQVKLLDSIGVGGIDSQNVAKRVEAFMRDGSPTVRRKAALLLLSMGAPRKDWLPHFVSIAESSATFADPKIVNALLQFDVPPEEYLPALLNIQNRLSTELTKPADTRTVTIYNDELWQKTLEKTISQARSRTKS